MLAAFHRHVDRDLFRKFRYLGSKLCLEYGSFKAEQSYCADKMKLL